MAKNVLPKHWNGSEFEELHIVTKASNVLTNDNKSVQQKMDDFTAHLAENVTDEGGVHGLEVEAGIFTPTIYGRITAGEPVYDARSGTYYRIGKICHIRLSIRLLSKGGMEGTLCIGGLPFTTAEYGAAVFPGRFTGLTKGAGWGDNILPCFFVPNSVTFLEAAWYDTGTAIRDTSLSDTSEIRIVFIYRIA